MITKTRRYIKQMGCAVEWGNVIGSHLGQNGTYCFASEEDAKSFANYAGRDDFPSLAPEDLKAEGIPEPELRSEGFGK